MLSPRLKSILNWVIQPAAHISHPEDRRKAQLLMLTALLMFLVRLLHPSLASASSDHSYLGYSPGAYLVLTLGLLLVIYTLARYGHSRMAMRYGVYLGSLALLVTFVHLNRSGLGGSLFAYFILIAIIANMFISLREIAALLVFQTGLIFVPYALRDTTPWQLTDALSFHLTTASILVLFAYYRNQLEALRQHTLAESEANYRNVFNSSVNAFLIHDGVHVVLCNEAAAKIVGYNTPEEMIGLRFEDYIYADDLKMVKERALQRVEQSDQNTVPERYQMRIQRIDGGVRWVESHTRMVQFQGRALAMAHSIDITERKAAEEALHFRLEFDKVVTSISTAFANLPSNEITPGIEKALGKIGNFLNADHAYVFLLNSAETHLNNTHEWAAPGITPNQERLQYLPLGEAPWFDQPQIKDKIGVFVEAPIEYQGKRLGFLALDTVRREVDWTADAVPLLRIVGEIFASALERQKAEQQIHERNAILETLNDLGVIISATLDTQPLLSNICRLTCEALHVTSVYISDWDEDKREMHVLAEYISPYANSLEKQSDIGVIYSLPSPLEPASVLILQVEDPGIHLQERQHMQQYGAQSLLRMPLIAEGRQNGFIEVWESRHPRQFSSYDLNLMLGIAQQTAFALNRAMLSAALQKSESLNNIILASLPDIILHYNREGRILDVKYLDAFDLVLPADEQLGKTVLEVLPSPLAQTFYQYIQTALETDTVQILEYGLDDIGGKTAHYEARLVKIAPDEVLCFARNITERKQVQQHQLDLHLEKERVRILEDFISDASHDLRTPISNLKSRLYLLRKAADPENRERQLTVLEAEINRLENLIEDLLTMAQLDNFLYSQSVVSIDVNILVLDHINAHRAAAEKKNLQLHFDPDPNISRVMGYGVELHRVVANLLSNAINYTPSGSVTVRTQQHEEGVLIAFKDTGIGINPDEVERIFERFYRADRARSTNSGGTGLGLAITKKIIELHHGTIDVESQPGEGTTFRVWLPRNPFMVTA